MSRMREIHEVVVSGIGFQTPIGSTQEEVWANLDTGKLGLSVLTPEDKLNHQIPDWFNLSIAGIIRNFDPRMYLGHKDIRRSHRSAQFATAAAINALMDAGLWKNDRLDGIDPYGIGIYVGSGFSGSEGAGKVLEGIKKGDHATVSDMMQTEPERAVTVPARHLGILGPRQCIATACSSGLSAIISAFEQIRNGNETVMVAGGAEAAVTGICLSGFLSMKALYTGVNIDRASIPMDIDRTGFVMSEGAVMLVLEEKHHALKRNATIWAEIAGYGQTGETYSETAPDPLGISQQKAMMKALQDAGLDPSDVGLVLPHATSTKVGDEVELTTLIRLFPHASLYNTKGVNGHGLGYAGSLSVAVEAYSLREKKIPGNFYLRKSMLDNPEELGLSEKEMRDINPDIFLPRTTLLRPVRAGLVNAFGFGGINASLVMTAPH